MPIGAADRAGADRHCGATQVHVWQIHKFRKTKPLFTMDFWNDGDAVGGLH